MRSALCQRFAPAVAALAIVLARLSAAQAESTYFRTGHLIDGRFSYSFATGASADGAVVAGLAHSDHFASTDFEPFRWSRETGIEGIGFLPGGGFRGEANAVNGDGSVIVGGSDSFNVDGEDSMEAFRWTRATGMIGLGDLPGGFFESEAYGVSGDGNVVVGLATPNFYSGSEIKMPFRWTSETGMVS